MNDPMQIDAVEISQWMLRRTNMELWRTLAAIGLTVLLFEWWWYHRRTV